MTIFERVGQDIQWRGARPERVQFTVYSHNSWSVECLPYATVCFVGMYVTTTAESTGQEKLDDGRYAHQRNESNDGVGEESHQGGRCVRHLLLIREQVGRRQWR